MQKIRTAPDSGMPTACRCLIGPRGSSRTPFPHVIPSPERFSMASLVAASGSAVRSVRVTGVAEGIFYAQVMLRGGGCVDARPSDALNLAAITGAPVYVADALLGVPLGA